MATAKLRFNLGQTVMTRGVQVWLQETERSVLALLPLVRRHLNGDWGDLSPADHRANEVALKHGDRILSAYHLDGTKLWIITEADRSSTCILFPHEY